MLIVVLGIGLCAYKPSKLKTITFLTLTGGFMLFIFASRYAIGFDYFNYYTLLNQCKVTSVADLLAFKGPIEPGFGLLLKLISSFTQDVVVMYIILGIIVLSVLMVYIYKYSCEPWISVYLFVSFGFMFGIMNLLRQYFAAIVFLFAIKYIKEKKILPFLIIVLIAASIHKSALIILPVYFICRLNISWKSLVFYFSITVLAYIFCDYFINFITQYVYKDYNLETGELRHFMAGMPWKFVFVPFIYCLTSVLMKNKLLQKDPNNLVLINFSIYTLIFWVMMTRHLLIERPSNYLYISSIVLGAEMISCLNPSQEIRQKISDIKQSIAELKKKHIKNKELEIKQHELKKAQEEFYEAKSYYVTAVVAVVILGFLNQVFAMSHGNHNVYPYKSIFTEKRQTERENSIRQIGQQQND